MGEPAHTETPYLQRIRALAPGLDLDQVTVNNEGLVNDVVIVNHEWVFRFPKADWAKAALKQETAILDVVRRYVDMPAPHFDYRDDTVMYRLLPGEPLHRNDILSLDETAKDAIADQLATFLRQLHAIPLDELQQRDIQPAESQRGYDDWMRLYDDVQRELYPLMMKHTREWVRRHFEAVERDNLAYHPALIHGDLAQYHILYDPAARKINGIIDFGVGGLGDPAVDYSNILNIYGETVLRRMAKYDPGVQPALNRARFMAGTMELQWLLGGVRSKDFSWFTVHIDRARDALPIGKRW